MMEERTNALEEGYRVLLLKEFADSVAERVLEGEDIGVILQAVRDEAEKAVNGQLECT